MENFSGKRHVRKPAGGRKSRKKKEKNSGEGANKTERQLLNTRWKYSLGVCRISFRTGLKGRQPWSQVHDGTYIQMARRCIRRRTHLGKEFKKDVAWDSNAFPSIDKRKNTAERKKDTYLKSRLACAGKKDRRSHRDGWSKKSRRQGQVLKGVPRNGL